MYLEVSSGETFLFPNEQLLQKHKCGTKTRMFYRLIGRKMADGGKEFFTSQSVRIELGQG